MPRKNRPQKVPTSRPALEEVKGRVELAFKEAQAAIGESLWIASVVSTN